jgi:ribosomal protein L13
MGEAMWRKLKVYAGSDHPHASQRPQGRVVQQVKPQPKKVKSEVA